MHAFSRLLLRIFNPLYKRNMSVQPKNQHFSVGPNGEPVVDLNFESEPLGMPAERGYGWTQWRFWDKVGPNARYTILRKLGWGSHSSTWLARDTVDETYVAIKAMTGHITKLHVEQKLWETGALHLLSSPTTSPHCLHSLTTFTASGSGSSGDHLCIVTPLYGGDVRALYHTHGVFSVPLAKHILLHLLRGLAFAHERGVIHTDLKMDNVLFTTAMTDNDISQFLEKEPPRLHDPEASYDGIVRTAVSQPLPMISKDEAIHATFLLADFGTAQPSRVHEKGIVTTPPLRPPEVLLGGDWDKPADIWSFGCLFTVGRSLFRFEPNEKLNLDPVEYMLYQMDTYSGDVFKAKQLTAWPLSAHYFAENCLLKKNPPRVDYPFEICIDVYSQVDPAEVSGIATFMRRCLRIDPEARATAQELLDDPWFEGVC